MAIRLFCPERECRGRSPFPRRVGKNDHKKASLHIFYFAAKLFSLFCRPLGKTFTCILTAYLIY
ncbi:MAG: hypothetical protein KBS46_05870, partial [Clostridiales bacterium]|nr:hypothetical protein [Candidatus Apopatocola equi]